MLWLYWFLYLPINPFACENKKKEISVNIKQAKQLDFPSLLEKMGYFPEKGGIKKGGNEIWYKSPLNHNDKTPSFHLTKGKQVAWVFKCFSTGEEGTIIDFVIAHEHSISNASGALEFLRDKFPGALFDYNSKRKNNQSIAANSFSSHQHPGLNSKHRPLAADRDLEYIEDLPLNSGRLISYLEESRKIAPYIAKKYLRIVRYKNRKNNKTYYAIGMKNRAGGFEIRAGSDIYSFKSALVARDISVFKTNKPSTSVLVFEGMLDFLSYLVMSGHDEPPCDCVVMHSVNSYRRAADYMKDSGYERICTYLDNDKTGHKYSAKFEAEFGGRVVSCSHQFHPYKDLNEALQHGKIIEPFAKTIKQLDFPIA